MEGKRNNIFISYSQEDSLWLEKLNIFLKPLLRSSEVFIWDDTQILAGQDWQVEIRNALDDARVAILLVSHNFLASDFINNEELPILLQAYQKNGLIIYWISISHCLYKESEIFKYQAINDPSKPLDSLPKHQQNKILVEICNKIKSLVDGKPFTKGSNSENEMYSGNYPVQEIVPDDWFSDKVSGGILGKIKKFF